MTRKLLICSPAKGGLPLHYFLLATGLIRDPIPGWEIDYLVEAANSALQMSRNILAHEVVKGNWDKALFLDTDHPVGREHIARILSHDVPIVSALYCIKRPGNPFFLGVRAKGAVEREDGLLEADFLPTGFLCVSAEALRKMAEFHKDREFYIHEDDSALPSEPKRTQATMAELFPVGVCGPRTPAARLKRVKSALAPILEKGVGSVSRGVLVNSVNAAVTALTDEQGPGNLLGEDYHCLWLAKEAGIPAYLDTHLAIPHRGSIDFPITDPAVVAQSCQPIPEAEGDLTKW